MKRSVIILLNLGYWAMFLLLLLIFFGMALPVMDKSYQAHKFFLLRRWVALMTGFAIVPGLISFYFYYGILFPKFLARKKFTGFFLLSVAVAVFAALVGGLALSFILFRPNFLFVDGFNSAISITALMSFGALVNGVIGLVMKGFISWYGDIRLKAEMNQKNFETELALVKSQLNPHFLFNTINNIDVLITMDPVRASAYLNQLSDIMRFMLYETKTEEITLARELAYIDKYIALQRIRTSNRDSVNYSLVGDPGTIRIAPMLFIPFIENAFKHTENSKTKNNAIVIRFAIDNDKVYFECENIYTENNSEINNNGGLGNELIAKRLHLLYPNMNSLEIKRGNYIYKVKLVINHHANELHHSRR